MSQPPGKPVPAERERIEKAMTALEAQRESLGDEAVEAALDGLRRRLDTLAQASAAGPGDAGTGRVGERRVVTVLFCDVKGSVTLAEQMDPEEWAAIMNAAFEHLIEPIYRNRGTVARLMGDAILAFFGAPTALEDDPQRAVLAGLEILDSVAPLREQLRRDRGLDFNVRVGINTGMAVVGDVGTERRAEYTAMGDAVNLAARMEQTAAPGTVQITGATYRLVSHAFECEPLGHVEVRGKAEWVPAYRVLGRRLDADWQSGHGGAARATVYVGREAELETVARALDDLRQGQGGVLLIVGEAGLGKSRLIAEVKERYLRALPVNWMEGRTLAYGRSISYWPFLEMLRSWADIGENEAEEDAGRKLDGRVAAVFGEDTPELLPYLASLLALPVRPDLAEQLQYLDEDGVGRQIYRSMRRFFQHLALQQPTVLVFDDLHWMDESSYQMLEHILPIAERLPLLIFGLSRPEPGSPVDRLRASASGAGAALRAEIPLSPLSRSDSAHLVHHLFSMEDLPANLQGLILSKAEGNPFFLEQVSRTLLDTGVVVWDPANRRWRAAAPVESVSLPDTLQGLIMARIDRLEEGTRQTLRTASVIGRSFLYRVLQAVASIGDTSQFGDLDRHLQQLLRLGMILEKQRAPELEYIFQHALVQEAAYGSILLQQRRELHARVGRAIESLFAERLDEFYSLAAYHYARAEEWEKAQEFLLKAGDQAGRLAGSAEALEHYRQAATVCTRIFGEQWDKVQRAAIDRKIGAAHFQRGEYTPALHHLAQAFAHLGRAMPETRPAVRQAILREVLRQVGHRLLPAIFLRPDAKCDAAGVAEEDRINLIAGRLTAQIDPELFLLLTIRGLNFYERHGLHPGIAYAREALGYVFDLLGLFGLGDHYYRLAGALALRLAQPEVATTTFGLMALHDLYLGRWDMAVGHGRGASEFFQRAGNLHDWGWATAWMGTGLVHRGELMPALKHGQELVQFGRDGADREIEFLGLLLQGLALLRLGWLEEGIRQNRRAVELGEAVPDYPGRVGAGAQLALCYLRQGDVSRALEEIEASWRVCVERSLREPSQGGILRNGLAEVYLAAAEKSGGQERAGWLRQAARAGREALRHARAYRPGRAKAMRMWGYYEWLRGRRVPARLWWNRSLAEAEALCTPYDSGRAHLEIGLRLGEHSHLANAEEIFKRLGAEWDLNRTRQARTSLVGSPGVRPLSKA